MNEDILERVKMLMARLNIGNVNRWSKLLGIPQSSLEKKIRGVQKFNVPELQRILEVHKEVSADWLLLGKGEMFVEESPATEDINALKKQIKEQNAQIKELNEQLKKKNQQIDVLLTEKVNLYKQDN